MRTLVEDSRHSVFAAIDLHSAVFYGNKSKLQAKRKLPRNSPLSFTVTLYVEGVRKPTSSGRTPWIISRKYDLMGPW